MMLPVAVPVVAATAASVTAAEITHGPWDIVVVVASVCTAAAVIAKFLHLPELLKGGRLFLHDWLGEPARDGVEARLSFPARMAKVEARTEALHHNLSVELNGRMDLVAHSLDGIQGRADENKTSLDRLEERLNDVDERINKRITDHRRRNEETVAALEAAIKEQADGRLIIETARAVLTELGHDLEFPHRPLLPPESTT